MILRWSKVKICSSSNNMKVKLSIQIFLCSHNLMYACLLSDIMEDENNELAIINNRCILLRICIVHRGSFSIHFSFHSFIAIKNSFGCYQTTLSYRNYIETDKNRFHVWFCWVIKNKHSTYLFMNEFIDIHLCSAHIIIKISHTVPTRPLIIFAYWTKIKCK